MGYESVEIIATKQFNMARALMNQAAAAPSSSSFSVEPLSGPVDFVHRFVNMSDVEVEGAGPRTARACSTSTRPPTRRHPSGSSSAISSRRRLRSPPRNEEENVPFGLWLW